MRRSNVVNALAVPCCVKAATASPSRLATVLSRCSARQQHLGITKLGPLIWPLRPQRGSGGRFRRRCEGHDTYVWFPGCGNAWRLMPCMVRCSKRCAAALTRRNRSRMLRDEPCGPPAPPDTSPCRHTVPQTNCPPNHIRSIAYCSTNTNCSPYHAAMPHPPPTPPSGCRRRPTFRARSVRMCGPTEPPVQAVENLSYTDGWAVGWLVLAVGLHRAQQVRDLLAEPAVHRLLLQRAQLAGAHLWENARSARKQGKASGCHGNGGGGRACEAGSGESLLEGPLGGTACRHWARHKAVQRWA